MKISEVNKQRIELYVTIFLIFLAISVGVNLYKASVIVKHGIPLTPERAVEAIEHPVSFDEGILAGYSRQKSFSSKEVTDWLRSGRTVIVGTDEEGDPLLMLYGADKTQFLAIDESGSPAEVSQRYRLCYLENRK